MMKKLLLFLMTLVMSIPIWAGEKTVTISRNDISQLGVYYCDKEGITMTFTSGMNNPNYLVEHQQVVFYIRSTNYVIKKIVFHCLDNTTENDLDAFYWGPTTISEEGEVGAYTPTGSYHASGYIGTWTGGQVDSKNVAFTTKGRPVRFGSVEITIEKEFGDIYQLVTSTDEIAAGNTYVLVSKYSSKALGKVENHNGDTYESFSSTPVTLLDHYTENGYDVYNKVKVTDEVSLIKLERAVSTTTTRPWHLKVGDNYIRRRNGTNTSGSGTNQGYNLYLVPSLPTDEFSLYSYRVSISFGTNYNALLQFYHPSGDALNSTDMAIRHYNGGSLFRVMKTNSSSNSDATYQRVYLYKPAENYEVTTECLPANENCGYITLGNGILTDDQNKNWSQQLDNVTFFVGPTDGWGIGAVTVTNLSTGEVQTLTPTNTSDFGNDYSFDMPGSNVKITANFLQPYNINTVSNPTDGGSFNFVSGYNDFNGQATSNEGKTVTFTVDPAEGYTFNSVTLTDNGTTTTLTPDANGVYSFTMPGNDVTLTANFDPIPYYVITTQCQPSDAGRIDVYDGITVIDNAITAAPGDVVTFWVAHYNDNVIQSVTVNREGGEAVTLNVLDGNEYGQRYSFTMPTGNVNIMAAFEPSTDLYLLGTAMGRTSWAPSGPKFNFDATNNEFYLDVYFKGGNDDVYTDQAFGYFSLASSVSNFDWTQRNQNSNDWSGVSGRLAALDNNTLVGDGSTDVVLYGDRPDNAFKIPAGVYRIKVNRAKTQMSIVKTQLQLTFDPASGATVESGATVQIGSDLQTIVYGIAGSYYMNEDAQKFRNTTDGNNWVSDNNQGENGAQATITQDGTTVNAEAWIGYIVVPGSATYYLAVPPTHNITWTCNPSEAGNITVPSTAQQGDLVTFTLDTNQNYQLSSVLVYNNNDPNAQPITPTDNGNGSYSFTMPDYDVVIMANFDTRKYHIYTEILPPQGAQIVFETSNGISSESGETISFRVSANDGYVLKEVTLSYVDENNETQTRTLKREDGVYEFTMPAADVTITVLLNYKITRVCLPPEGGSLSCATNAAEGTLVRATPKANYGYEFREVTMSYVDENNVTHTTTLTDPNENGDYFFTMPAASVTITAYFDKLYNVNTICVPNDGGSIVVAGSNKVIENTPVSFTVVPSIGYALVDVTLTYVDEDNVTHTSTLTPNENGIYNFVMPASDVTITANFDPVLIPINAVCIPQEGGFVNVAESAYHNDRVTFTVTPSPEYFVGEVTLTNNLTEQVTTLSPVNGSYSFDMPNASVTITAHFSLVGDLYLLGTHNGATVWTPNGSKFDYNPETGNFTLLVYYKGIRDVDGQEDDHDGYLNLTTVIDDEDWDVVNPHRLVALRPTTSVMAPYTGSRYYPLYKTTDGYDPNNKFQIDAGVYILTVPADKSGISFTQVPVTLDLSHSPAGEKLLDDTFVSYGTVVTATSDLDQIVHNINPDEVVAQFYMEGRNDYEEIPYSERVEGNKFAITHEGYVFVNGNAYIGWINANALKKYNYTPLHFLELGSPAITYGRPQIVCDTLIGVWAAERVLWAKDIGNKACIKDSNSKGCKDYGIDIANMQDAERGWDQSNWVKLDFTDYLESQYGISSENVESENNRALEVLNQFVNKQIKPLSIKGYLTTDMTYRIIAYQEPVALKDTIGYPGYMQDPLELLYRKPEPDVAPLPYYYNHYTPGNFMGTNYLVFGEESGLLPEPPLPEDFFDWSAEERETWIKSNDEYQPLWNLDWTWNGFEDNPWTEEEWELFDSIIYNNYGEDWQYDPQYQLYFVRGKPCEIAHVWAVWRGDGIGLDEDGNEVDYGQGRFTVYKKDVNAAGDTTYNWYDLSAAFTVGGWQYNRLTSSPVLYGQPTENESLQVNCAYEFHIAIEVPGEITLPNKKSPRRAPDAKDCEPNDSYLIYPLDLTGSGAITSVPEVSVVGADKTIKDIRYYNIMGQESKTPFEGINIEVIRYQDGSMISRKILK